MAGIVGGSVGGACINNYSFFFFFFFFFFLVESYFCSFFKVKSLLEENILPTKHLLYSSIEDGGDKGEKSQPTQKP